MKADNKTSEEVEAVIQKLTGAYKARNLNDVMACFASDDDVSLIGTGADEKRIGPAQIQSQVERDWSQTDSIEMTFTWKLISATGPVAWVNADGSFNIQAGGQAMALPARVSFVLEKRAGRAIA